MTEVGRDEAIEMLRQQRGLTFEEATAALALFDARNQPLPGRARLRTGLQVRILEGAVSKRVAQDWVRRGFLVPEAAMEITDAT